jgi:signal transduction histidine kinase
VARSLQSRVIALGGMGVFGAAAVLTLVSRGTLRSLEGEFEIAHQRLAGAIAASISRDLLSDLEALQGAAIAPSIDLHDTDVDPEQRAVAAALRSSRLAGAVCFTLADGSPLVCEPSLDAPRLARPAAAREIRTAIAADRPKVTDAILLGGATAVLVIVPLHVDGHPADGAAVEIISTSDPRFAALLAQDDGVQHAPIAVVDGAGHVLAAEGRGEAAADGEACASIAGTAWTVRVTPPSAALAPIDTFRYRSAFIAAALAGVATLLAFGIAWSIRRPLKSLIGAAERIAAGNLDDPITADSRDEIGRLAGSLEEMRTRLKQSIHGIEAANEELEQRVQARTSELRAVNLELQERERTRQRLLRKVISAQEDERRRIARELHDETSQLVAALGIGLDRLAGANPADAGRAAAGVAELRQLLTRMHEGLHRLIVNLRPSVLDDLGLAAAIQWLAEHHLPRDVAVRCELGDIQDLRLPPEIEIAVFRVAQEAIANIARHAQAETVLVQGGLNETGRLLIEIEDDGRGFEPQTVDAPPGDLRGIGLLGMRERMELAGGRIRIDSAPGQGTQVAIELDIAALLSNGSATVMTDGQNAHSHR